MWDASKDVSVINIQRVMISNKRILLSGVLMSLFLLASARVGMAQGVVLFNNNITSRISTNIVIGGPAAGSIAGAGKYRFALFYSTNATSVNGQTTAIIGNTNSNFAFNDPAWTFVAYGTNTTTVGRFASMVPDVSGQTTVPGVPGGATARFVIIGWSANIGTDIAALASWFNNQALAGWVGQSAVSPPVTVGDNASLPAPLLVVSNVIPAFTLGMSGTPDPVPPSIFRQPTNLTVWAGSPASFSVIATGTPFPGFQWRFNGGDITGATNTSYSIAGAQAGDAGGYTVVVSNYAGSVTSSVATLTVAPAAPPTITAQPGNLTVGAGSNASFTVTVTGSPPLNYQWLVNGTNVINGTNATLTLTDVQPSNAGSYSVTITNAFGSTNSAAASLTVLTFPPVITAQPQDVSAPVSTQVSFGVTVTGSPPLSYQWLFNGTNLPGATASVLTISGVQSNNAGSYSVAISNAYGATNSTTAMLAVTPAIGYVIFQNTLNSATKIFTNSTIGGPVTGLTATNARYYFALYASATATTVGGTTNSILGNASTNYVFYDNQWTLVAYGTNATPAGRLRSTSANLSGQTPIAGFAGGTTARFVVVGWSGNIGSDIGAVTSWFNGGSPPSDGWIGESTVSGGLTVSDGGIMPPTQVFGTFYPSLHGFTLGLVSPDPSANYPTANGPAAVLTTVRSGNSVIVSWPASYSSYDLQSAPSPVGLWADLGMTPTLNGTNLTVTVQITGQEPFFRLIVK